MSMKISSKSLLNFASLLIVAATFHAATAFAQDSTDAQAPDSTDATASIPGILPAFITAGPIDPDGKVPEFNGVPGSGVTNLDLPIPTTTLNHGQSYVYTFAFQDYDFTGDYTASYVLTQSVDGKTKTLESGTFATHATSPGNYWAWVTTGKPIPDSPGLARLEAILKYGASKTTVSINVAIK